MLPDAFQILQQQSTGIALLDRELVVMYLNESAETLFHTSLRRAVGQPFPSLIREGEPLLESCQRVLAGSRLVRLRNCQLLLFSSPIRKSIECRVSWVDDSADGRLLMEMNEIRPAGKPIWDGGFLERQQANQAVIRGMAHEIRNPLGGVRGAAQLLAEETGSERFAEYTQIILRETDRLTALVNRMQARTRANLDEWINIHQVTEHVRQLLQADVGDTFRLLQDYDPSLPEVRGNRDLLVQALLNVMCNAAEALQPQSGEKRIWIRTRIDCLMLPDCRKQVVRLEIEDNGPGIDPDIESGIFDPMVTNKTDGTGLGLPITAEIITQLGGFMDFASHPGKTIFRMFLPTVQELPSG